MTKNASVLIVDDEEINRRVATLFLERAGYAVRAVKDAAEAWAILQQQDFDLVLLDISMPGESGISLCQRIRQDYRGNQPAVIAYTAHAMAIEQDEIRQAGFDAIATKPVSKKDLLQQITNTLQKH